MTVHTCVSVFVCFSIVRTKCHVLSTCCVKMLNAERWVCVCVWDGGVMAGKLFLENATKNSDGISGTIGGSVVAHLYTHSGQNTTFVVCSNA